MENKTSQVGFLKFYQIVICRASHRAWGKFGGWGTLIGIVFPIVAVVITKQPKSLGEFLREDAVLTAELIVGLFALVLLLYIGREPVIMYNKEVADKEQYSSRINAMLETKPNISIGDLRNEITPLRLIRRTASGSIIELGQSDTVERFYVEFINKKKENTRTEDALGVYVKIDFFDTQSLVMTNDKPRWWGPIDMFDERDWYREVTIKANGKPEKLYLVIRKINDGKIYVFGVESHNSRNFIVPSLELKADIHFIHIQLSATNLDTLDYWIRMESKKKEQPLFTMLNTPPHF